MSNIWFLTNQMKRFFTYFDIRFLQLPPDKHKNIRRWLLPKGYHCQCTCFRSQWLGKKTKEPGRRKKENTHKIKTKQNKTKERKKERNKQTNKQIKKQTNQQKHFITTSKKLAFVQGWKACDSKKNRPTTLKNFVHFTACQLTV